MVCDASEPRVSSHLPLFTLLPLKRVDTFAAIFFLSSKITNEINLQIVLIKNVHFQYTAPMRSYVFVVTDSKPCVV